MNYFSARCSWKRHLYSISLHQAAKIEKIPPIKHEDKVGVTFKDKCDIFLKAMFPNPPQTSPVELESDNNSTKPWFSVISEEIKKAIMTSSTKKAPGPDGLSFLIIQHAYQAIPELFHTVYSVLINQGYHPICWRQGTGAILKRRQTRLFSTQSIQNDYITELLGQGV
jgi:hypothetical protein